MERPDSADFYTQFTCPLDSVAQMYNLPLETVVRIVSGHFKDSYPEPSQMETSPEGFQFYKLDEWSMHPKALHVLETLGLIQVQWS